MCDFFSINCVIVFRNLSFMEKGGTHRSVLRCVPPVCSNRLIV